MSVLKLFFCDMFLPFLLICIIFSCYFTPTECIECVPLKTCPLAMKIISAKKDTPEFRALSYCGKDKNFEPKVWCIDDYTDDQVIDSPDFRDRNQYYPENMPYTHNNFHSHHHNPQPKRYSGQFNPSGCDNADCSEKRFGDSFEINNNFDNSDMQFSDSFENDNNFDRSEEQFSNSFEEDNKKTGIDDFMFLKTLKRFGNGYDSDNKNYHSNNDGANFKGNRVIPSDDKYPWNSQHNHHHFHSHNSLGYGNNKVHRSKDYDILPEERTFKTFTHNHDHDFTSNPISTRTSEHATTESENNDPYTTESSVSFSTSSDLFNESPISASTDTADNNVKSTHQTKQWKSRNSEFESLANVCGRSSKYDDRIFGGIEANLGEFPWVALLQYQLKNGLTFGCGGTLISSRYVLTAAHCLDEDILISRGLNKLYRVVLGEYDTRNKTDCISLSIGTDCAEDSKSYEVESVKTHELFKNNNVTHDIALIRLNQEVKFTDYIRPICLPSSNFTLKENENFTIAGWGRTPTENFSPVLRKAKLSYNKKSNCKSFQTKSRSLLIEGQMCIGNGNGTDSCRGDSGGPAMLNVPENFEIVTYLIGIISYGFITCGNAPSVNTYVPYYLSWIYENVK